MYVSVAKLEELDLFPHGYVATGYSCRCLLQAFFTCSVWWGLGVGVVPAHAVGWLKSG